MVVEARHLGERGQSILEFLILLPALVGMVVLLIRTNSAIQMSIVDQQYARAQALWLAFNSPTYPELRLRVGAFFKQGYNQMVIGVSDNVAPAPDEDEYIPHSSEQNIASKKAALGEDTDKDAKKRAHVRIRDTVAICTQTNVAGPGLPLLDVSNQGGVFVATTKWSISETPTQFDFCGSPFK
ncbi:MAG: hypothetical protein ACXWPM_02890 [Bdellovibrionota bacterium]